MTSVSAFTLKDRSFNVCPEMGTEKLASVNAARNSFRADSLIMNFLGAQAFRVPTLVGKCRQYKISRYSKRPRSQAKLHDDQNTNFNANCITRGSPASVDIRPAAALVMSFWGSPN